MPALRPYLYAAALAGLALCSGHALAEPAKAPPVKPVDAAKFYTGRWIEIGRRPMKLTDGCVAGATNYLPQGGVKVKVVDTCTDKTPPGKLKSIGGPGTIKDPGTNAKLHVSYRLFGFFPVGRDYWVRDHDDAYTWFISSNPAFTDLWIYTREARPDPALVDSLVKKAAAMGYDVSKLEFPAQP